MGIFGHGRMSQKTTKILFLVPYPLGIAASQRFRFEQYFGILDQAGIEYDVQPFLDHNAFKTIYSTGNLIGKLWNVFTGFVRRMYIMFRLGRYDFVFVHREAEPLGLPVFEWIITKIAGKKMIFDFDDAIWLKNLSTGNPLMYYVKRYANANNAMKWAHKVSCGNRYLAEQALKFNSSVVVNPTTIDTLNHHNKVRDFSDLNKVVIGWTGTHSTIPYLESIVEILQELEQEFDFEFMVIADREPEFNLKSLRFVKWSKETEIDDLLKMHVGVMPLVQDQWSQGKCGFKALQYMALGIPAIVSPVGVNTKIVDHEVNGFVCETKEEWRKILRSILEKPQLLQQFSELARKKIETNYSVKSNTPEFLHLFDLD
jgi:glycosyltransferase involved in cell wall biosynthesis